MNILVARAFGKGSAAFGQVTLATQLAFVVGAATRFGMDMASVRRVAIDVGKGEPGRARAVMVRAAAIAGVVSAAVALAVVIGAPALARAFAGTSPSSAAVPAFRAAAPGLPVVAL